MSIKITDELTDEQCALECLKKDCLSCRRCAIGGCCLDGTKWDFSVELGRCGEGCEPSPICNVFSSMNLHAEVMVVGQNPGAEEVNEGVPFVGDSGKVFNRTLKEVVGIDRKDLYVTNTVKCYTPGNRKPTQGEVDNCRDFLDLEIRLVRPKLIVAIGSYAFKSLTGMSGIMRHCGAVVVSPRYLVPVFAMLHPSPLNTNNPERNAIFLESAAILSKLLRKGIDG